MNAVYIILLCAAFAAIEVLIGGTRLLFSLPSYGILALAGLLSTVDLRRAKPSPSGACLIASALFFGYILLRAAFSPVAYLAWTDSYMVLGALIVYGITACYLTDPRRRLWVLAFLLVLVGANLLVGASQFSRGDNLTVFGFIRATQYEGRASGYYICPDHLAGFLEIVGCLALSVALWGRIRPWIRLLYGYGALCCFGGLLITGSRGGFLSAGAGLGVLVVLGLWRTAVKARDHFWRALVGVLVACGLLAVVLAGVLKHSETLGERAKGLLDRGDIRLLLWPAAIAQFKLAPVFGTGSATYVYYGRLFRNPVVQNDPIRTHSDYLELLAEYGAVGAAGLLLFLGTHALRGLRSFRVLNGSSGSRGGSTSNAAAWNIGALAATTCIAAHSVVDFNMHIPANALLMAFVFGVVANPGRNLMRGGDGEGDSPVRFRRADLFPRLALPVIGIWLLVFAVPRLPGEFYAEKARVALRDGRYAAALGFAQKGIDWEKDSPALHGYLGEARLKASGSGPDTPFARSFRLAAAQAYTEAVRLAPLDSLLLTRLGETYIRLEDYPAAEQTLNRALARDPNSSFVLTCYGFFLQRVGRDAEAKTAFNRALKYTSSEGASRGLEELARREDSNQ